MKNVPYEIKTIINVANQLATTGKSGASTGERIAAEFVLNRMEFLPASYPDVLDAWDRLDDEWQEYVKLIKEQYDDLLVPW
ncbi:hypothetical protein [Marinimicrobium locisalis]|uniref:hypothetical protein n=1 Tax=Marinimicrobium locisalis TaxID=546022 RepID=UPI0032214850